MEEEYSIRRPPLSPTFDLPEREDLLRICPGDLVKLVFNDAERMWVEVWDCCSPCKWTGSIKNNPVTEDCEMLEYDSLVEFHPLDIIDVMPFDQRTDLGDDSPDRMYA